MISVFLRKKKDKKKGELYSNIERTYHNEEPEYQKLVGIFRGDIRLRLIPKQILHLLFLIDEREKDKIRKIGDIDPALATDLLLDSIKSSPDPGRWREFLNALEKTKFTCLLKKIRRHEIVDDTEQRKYVSIMMPQLREMINPREIMAHLLHHDLLISDDKEEIECVMSNKGAIEASELLLERVSGKHPNWYGILTKLLLKHGHKGAGDMLKVGFCKEPTTTQRYPPRSQSDSELMRTGKKSTRATEGANKRPTTHLEHGYTDYSLRTCTDEEDDERIYAAIDDTELDTLEENRNCYKLDGGIHKSLPDRNVPTRLLRKMRDEVKPEVQFTGGATCSEEDSKCTYGLTPAEVYEYEDESFYLHCYSRDLGAKSRTTNTELCSAYSTQTDYDDTANVEEDKNKITQKYRSRSPPLLPLLPPRRPIATTPDLVPPTFPDDYGDIYEGFDYVQVVKQYDPKYSGQHSLKVGDVYRIQNPLLGGDDDGFYRSIEGKLIPQDNVKIFHKKPIPTPKKRTSLANEDGGYMQTPKPDKQAPPSDQSHQNDTGKKSDRDLLIDLLEANKNIMESQKDIKSSIAEHQKILNVVFETPIYQDYYNSKLTGKCQRPPTDDNNDCYETVNGYLVAGPGPVVPPRDDNGEESDHHTEADEGECQRPPTDDNYSCYVMKGECQRPPTDDDYSCYVMKVKEMFKCMNRKGL
ncbi:uncharacterized protein LOC128236641 isoform X3 [Mya arenaria]|uniref:uncharacterized protein LOC128236641 isoform X3 n=1 Tax=Mya arenaria TaxID=6604 RepID=UPI0022E1A4C5|nr:uncharacterized protein LOC128236641 isoform X3 [Mya arenaria]